MFDLQHYEVNTPNNYKKNYYTSKFCRNYQPSSHLNKIRDFNNTNKNLTLKKTFSSSNLDFFNEENKLNMSNTLLDHRKIIDIKSLYNNKLFNSGCSKTTKTSSHVYSYYRNLSPNTVVLNMS